jgi:hypothetical protein
MSCPEGWLRDEDAPTAPSVNKPYGSYELMIVEHEIIEQLEDERNGRSLA